MVGFSFLAVAAVMVGRNVIAMGVTIVCTVWVPALGAFIIWQVVLNVV